MQTTYQQMHDLLKSLQELLQESTPISLIERDIFMDELRYLYHRTATMEVIAEATQPVTEMEESTPVITESLPDTPEPEVTPEVQQEESAPEPVAATPPANPAQDEEPAPKYKVSQGLEDDVDLFFSMDLPETTETETKEEMDEHIETLMSDLLDEKKEIPVAETTPDEDELLFVAPRQPEKVNPEPVTPVAPERKPDPVQPQPASQPVGPKPVTPKVESTQRSLNDLFAGKAEDRSVANQFQQSKVVDLTKAISVNDKFTFIRELFNNKGEEFSAAIQKLNQCHNMDEAFNCLEMLKKEHFWDTTSTAYLSLCDLIRRRYL